MKISKFPKEINEDLAEETGWHIGDGSMNYYNSKGYKRGLYQLRGHIEDDKEHYIKRILPIFKKLYGIKINAREMPSTRVFGFQIWSTNLIEFKETLGLKTGPKTEVAIPSKFMINSQLKNAVLRGIFDTDGCLYLEKKNNKLYPRLQISTISINLANQLKEILEGENINAKVNKSHRTLKGNRKPSYVTVVRGPTMLEEFMKKIKPQNPKHIKKHIFFKESFK